jgi:hypothetical protein
MLVSFRELSHGLSYFDSWFGKCYCKSMNLASFLIFSNRHICVVRF